MSTKLTLLELLTENTGTYISGQEIADQLGISRNSVWKAVKKLQDQGYEIESMPSRGYRLVNTGDILSADYLKENIKHPCRITVMEKTGSTNNEAKAFKDLSLPQIGQVFGNRDHTTVLHGCEKIAAGVKDPASGMGNVVNDIKNLIAEGK